MRVISWNCNSANIRWEHVLCLIEKYKPNVLMLQETRCSQLKEVNGYHVYHNPSIKGRNGVAILSIEPLINIGMDSDGRMISGNVGNCVYVCVYVPNGGSVSSSVQHKLEFFGMLEKFYDLPHVIIGGDFNVLYKSTEHTIMNPYSQQEKDCLLKLEQHLKYSTRKSTYITWWDYRGGAFYRNEGYGLDKIYHSSNLIMSPIEVLYEYRSMEKPSDHAPVVSDLCE